MKYLIIASREISFEGVQDGKTIEGKMYIALPKTGTAIEFFSRNEYDVIEGLTSYNEKEAIELNLVPKLRRDGKLGWIDRTENQL